MCGSSYSCGSPGVGLGAPWDAVIQPPHTASARGPQLRGQQAPQSLPPTQDPSPAPWVPCPFRQKGTRPTLTGRGAERREMWKALVTQS